MSITGPLADCLAALASTPAGLGSAQARERLLREGTGETERSPLRAHLLELLRAIANPLALILLSASAVSAVLGQRLEASIITTIVLLSAGVSFLQTFRSTRAVQRLQSQIAPTATVLRDAAFVELPRAALVTGDVVRLSAGDLVPADVRLLESHDLYVQQAALTGESLPVEKSALAGPLPSAGPDAPALLFLGTSVVSGVGTAVVVAKAGATAFGDIAARLAAAPAETEFERGTRRFSALIMRTVLFLVLFILVIRLGLKHDALESLLFAVALAVGLTPEFLPVITTVTLASGAARMARDKVIVKHLSAIQNLGAIDVLCSDKTGTLTSGTMSLAASIDAFGQVSERALALARVNSAFETGIKSPIDAAILAGGAATAGYQKTDEIPFDFERRCLSVVVEKDQAFLLITKGAPEGVLAACVRYESDGATHELDAPARARCDVTERALSAQGYRVIAVACRSVTTPGGHSRADERELTLVGFLTFADQPMEGVAECLAALREDGVNVKILTGDNELVTRHVCEQVGIEGREIVLGSEIERMSESALSHVVEVSSVFARVSPAQKQRILRALQHNGHVVGFMGDGINDAPSLHAADVGISVAGAADVAKDAADIVLLERKLSVLHNGIRAGRRAFANVLKYLLMGTSSNFGNMLSMAGAAAFMPFLPMLPAQILLNNFLYDIAQVTIPSDNIDPEYVRSPRRWDVGLIRRFMLGIGPISSLFDFVTFYLLLRVFRFDEAHFHTGWFVESLATQTLVLFVIRTARRPWSNRPSAALAATTLAVLGIALALPFSPLGPTLGLTPLPARYFAFLVVVVLTYLTVVELVKQRMMKQFLAPQALGAPR